MGLFLFVLMIGGLSNSVIAQTYVTANQALEKLEIKLSDIHKSVDQRSTPAIEKDIADKFINYLAKKIEMDELIPNALQMAETQTMQVYSQNETEVSALKNELDTLLQE